ncbi:oligosaccharide flippase family protein [Pseudomonas sp. PDM19]|uniref:oligosaccharide flippase family protein n=1 Tax=Pseudomonas sp. PDM19 TaxID=2769272 RepID=UPI001780608D|nr:oligosaccharide flippase family protein [Pseudomonas sp. PDM19]MBD9632589.1 oligosaccharide flippase family protein [Pseudomonas sp. PDM19]
MQHTEKLYKAIGKSMLSRYTVYAANIISLMLLSRLFTPEIFGTVASIAVLLVFFQILSEAGLGPAVINIDHLPPADRDGIFSLTLIIGIIFSISFIFATPLIAKLYNSVEIIELTPFGAITLFFYSASILPNAMLLRDQNYYKLSIIGLCAEICSTLTASILLQYIDPKIALIGKTASSSAISFISAYYFSSHTEFGRPRLGRKISAVYPLLSFSLYQFLFNLINYFSRNLDNILVGRVLGTAALGVYDRAYQIMRYPLILLSFAMTPAIQPTLRRHANDLRVIEKIHTDFSYKLSLIACPLALAIILLSKLIVKIILGEKWIGVAPLISIFAFSIPAQVVLSTIGSFFQAINKVNLLFLSGLISAATTISLIAIGIHLGNLEKLSWLLVAAFYINYLQSYFIFYRFGLSTTPLIFYKKQTPQLILFIIISYIFYSTTN